MRGSEWLTEVVWQGREGLSGTYIAINPQFEILSKVKTLDDSNVPNIKKPNVGQHLSGKRESSHDSTENIDVDLHVGRRIYHR